MTDALENEKYVVFKKEDYDELRWGDTMPNTVDDAVVIRLKDPFAATALFTYANTIMSFVELMTNTYMTRPADVGMNPGEVKRMMEIADYFHQQACASQEISGKRLPD